MRVNVGHVCRRGTFEQDDRPVGTSSERRRLRKEASIRQRRGEICVSLPLDNDAAVNVVITDSKTLHLNIEVAAFPCEVEQCGVSFRDVDAKPVSSRSRHGIALGISVSTGGLSHLEGKAKDPRSGETINESCTLPRRLRASA
jgi:hypothetical protein